MRLGIRTVVIVEHSQNGRWVRIQARSHFSLGAGGLLTLIATLSALTLALAVVAAWNGFWPVLVIAALQVVLLGMILVRAWKSAWAVETITIDSKSIAVLQEQYAASSRLELGAAWARVILRKPSVRWYLPTLWLSSGTTQVELGAYLNAGEKGELAEALRQAIGARSAWQHQKIEAD
jgi:uncharacterized membrane protein